MNWSQDRSQVAIRPGHLRPCSRRSCSRAALAAASLTAVYSGRSAAASFLRSLYEISRMEARIRWITQVCTIALGQVASIASGRPFSPSQHTISTSLTPRLRSSASTPPQNRAPSAAAIQMPSTCLNPPVWWSPSCHTSHCASSPTRHPPGHPSHSPGDRPARQPQITHDKPACRNPRAHTRPPARADTVRISFAAIWMTPHQVTIDDRSTLPQGCPTAGEDR